MVKKALPSNRRMNWSPKKNVMVKFELGTGGSKIWMRGNFVIGASFMAKRLPEINILEIRGQKKKKKYRKS